MATVFDIDVEKLFWEQADLLGQALGIELVVVDPTEPD